MCKRLWSGVMCIFAFPALVSCQPLPEPQSILKKAIAAHGGKKNITKPRMGVLKGISKAEGPEISQEETFDLPKRWKRVTTGTFEGERKVSFNLMIQEKLWQWEEGAEAQPARNQAGAKSHFAAIEVLLDLTDEKVKLSPLKRITVNNQSAIGFRAVWDGGTADYYFDEKTELLLQSRFGWQPERGIELESKTVFGEYKEIDGVKFPHRRTSYIKGGNFKDYVLLSDFTITEVKFVDSIPDNAFSLPKKN